MHAIDKTKITIKIYEPSFGGNGGKFGKIYCRRYSTEMRISIIGHSASGKSTLARRISEKFDVPHLHMDKFWFEADRHRLTIGDLYGQEKARQYVRNKVREFVQQDAWVSDGWYPRIQPIIAARADRMIFLDISLLKRILNHIRRVLSGERHKVFSIWSEVLYVPRMVYRTYARDKKMRQFVFDNTEKVVTLRSFKEAEHYLKNLQ